jgi:addiction module RelE/StbE family toxin
VYDRLEKTDKVRVDQAIILFSENPFDITLDNQLHGELKEFRSIKAGFDLRILYTEEGGHVTVTFVKVGRHKEVYK